MRCMPAREVCERCAYEMDTCERGPGQRYAYKMHVYEMLAYGMHACL